MGVRPDVSRCTQLYLRNVNNNWDVGQILVQALGSGPALWRSVLGVEGSGVKKTRGPGGRSTSDAGGFGTRLQGRCKTRLVI